MVEAHNNPSSFGSEERNKTSPVFGADPIETLGDSDGTPTLTSPLEAGSNEQDDQADFSNHSHNKPSLRIRLNQLFSKGGKLKPFRLLTEDVRNIRKRYVSDWTTFNQLVFASAVYVFFTNILPGITFASDLYVLTGRSWGTIEIVFSTGLCGIIFSV